MIDLIITLGGDGTILWASKQFHGSYIPPLLCFALGSLGYLCNFTFDEYPTIMRQVFNVPFKLHLDNRIRLSAGVKDRPIRNVYKGNNYKDS